MTSTHDIVFGGPWKVVEEDGRILGSSLTYLENPNRIENLIFFLLGQRIETITSPENSRLRDCHIIFEGGAQIHYFDVASQWRRWEIRPINSRSEFPVESSWQQEWRPLDFPIPATPIRAADWLYNAEHLDENIHVSKSLEPMLSPLVIAGQSWSFIALCPWRLSTEDGELISAYGHYSEPKELKPLVSARLLTAALAGNANTSDLRLIFEGGLSLEVFPLSPALAYSFQGNLDIPDSARRVQRAPRGQLPAGWKHSAPPS